MGNHRHVDCFSLIGSCQYAFPGQSPGRSLMDSNHANPTPIFFDLLGISVPQITSPLEGLILPVGSCCKGSEKKSPQNRSNPNHSRIDRQ